MLPLWPSLICGPSSLAARPITAFVSLLGSGIPMKEQILIAFTGPCGVVLIAVAGFFGERLLALGFPDAALIGPLAFVLEAVTVVLHGFTLAPFARFLGLTGADIPGVIVIGGSPWTTALAEAIKKADVPVLMADPNFGNLRAARTAGIETFSGDILSEAAEQRLELVSFATLIAATSNDAYNTLVATDLAPEFGRDNVFQVMREKSESARHQLPRTLGGRKFGPEETHEGMNKLVRDGWTFRVTRLTEEFTFQTWRSEREDGMLVVWISPKSVISFIRKDEEMKGAVGVWIIAMRPPQSEPEVANIQPPADA